MNPHQFSDFGPFPGPRPFGYGDAEVFHGRHADTQELANTILAYSVTVLYAQSGAGKSSLLAAGVCPYLIKKNATVVLASLKQPDDVHEPLISSLERAAVRLETTNGSPAAIPHTGDIFGNSDQEQPHILIVDQAEELVREHGRLEARRIEFMQTLVDRIARHDNLRILLSLREEYVARLEPFAWMFPEGFDIRYRLSLLSKEDALEAIRCPIEFAGKAISEDAAALVVERVRSFSDAAADCQGIDLENVEPLYLQIQCARLWAYAKERRIEEIDSQAVDALGDVKETVEQYYNEQVSGAADATGIPEGIARRLVSEHLIGPQETRRAVRAGALKEKAQWLFNALATSGVIRLSTRADDAWYELAHTRLVKPVDSANTRWWLKNDDPAGTGMKLEDDARRALAPEGPSRLLVGRPLRRAEAWRAKAGEVWGGSQRLNEWIDKSISAQRERRGAYRRAAIWMLPVAVAVLGLVGIPAAAYMRRVQQDADTKNAREIEARNQAESKSLEATFNAQLANIRLKVESDPTSAARDLEVARTLHSPPFELPTEIMRKTLLHLSSGPIRTLQGFNGRIRDADIDDTGSKVVYATDHDAAGLLDLKSGKVSDLQHPSNTSFIRFTSSRDDIVISSSEQVWHLRPAPSGYDMPDKVSFEALQATSCADARVTMLARDRDNDSFVAGLSTGQLAVWPTNYAGADQPFCTNDLKLNAPVSAFALSGPNIAVGSTNGAISLWSRQSKKQLRELQASAKEFVGQNQSIRSIAFSSDGERVAAGVSPNRPSIWVTDRGGALEGAKQNSAIQALEFRPGHNGALVSAAYFSDIKILGAGRPQNLIANLQYVTAMATVGATGRYLVAGGSGPSASIWDLDTEHLVGWLPHSGKLTMLRATAQGTRLLMVTSTPSISVWDLDQARLGSTLPIRSQTERGAASDFVHAVSEDGAMIAVPSVGLTGGSDDVVVYPLRSGTAPSPESALLRFPGNLAPIRAIKFDPSGKMLAVGTGARVLVWLLEPDRPKRPIVVEMCRKCGLVRGVAWTRNGKYLAARQERNSTTGDEADLKIWSTSSLTTVFEDAKKQRGAPATRHDPAVVEKRFEGDMQSISIGTPTSLDAGFADEFVVAFADGSILSLKPNEDGSIPDHVDALRWQPTQFPSIASVAASGDLLAVASDNGELVFRGPGAEQSRIDISLNNKVTQIAARGDFIAVGYEYGMVEVYDRQQNLVEQYWGNGTRVASLSISSLPDHPEKYLIGASSQDGLTLHECTNCVREQDLLAELKRRTPQADLTKL